MGPKTACATRIMEKVPFTPTHEIAPVVPFVTATSSSSSARRTFEESPAYNVLTGMLEAKFRRDAEEDLDLVPADSSRCFNLLAAPLVCCGVTAFEVPNGHVRLGEDGDGAFLIYGAGVHFVKNVFMRIQRKNIPLTDPLIEWGDRTIVTVKQGYIGYAEDKGQPVLLPPGLHEWRSSTLKFQNHVDLNNTMIKLGPLTIITVDEGYSAITQNNGTQVVLPGGGTHLLNHRNWKFEKFMTEKIQTDDLQRIEATSADNVMIHTDATVVWRVTNVKAAAKMSAETMRRDGKDSKPGQSDINKLRNDVLKQATASLAAFIGEIRYSDSFHISAAGSSATTAIPVQSDNATYSPIFDSARIASAVEAANTITQTYGVTILSINIISAVPADKSLQQALAKGAVASADAERAETVAHGDAKAVRIRAEADAEAERIRAEGARSAAELLSTNQVAVDLARISKTGEALQGAGTNTLFFGADSASLGGLMSNPNVVKAV